MGWSGHRHQSNDTNDNTLNLSLVFVLVHVLYSFFMILCYVFCVTYDIKMTYVMGMYVYFSDIITACIKLRNRYVEVGNEEWWKGISRCAAEQAGLG